MKKTWLYIILGAVGTIGAYALVRGLLTGKIGRKNRNKIKFIWR